MLPSFQGKKTKRNERSSQPDSQSQEKAKKNLLKDFSK